MRKYTLAFRIRDLVEKECQQVPPTMGMKILELLDQYLKEEADKPEIKPLPVAD